MNNAVRSFPEYRNHEQIIKLNDPKTGLKGFIAIHNTNLGPALGGTRIFPYKSSTDALRDALKLSHAMTYKCAIAGMPFGGGKGVISADPKQKNIKNILRSYAEAVDKLKGIFYTGEDVGLEEKHVQHMLKFSPYFIGKSHLAGDPSPYAAESAFLCAKVGAKFVFGTESLKGKKVFIKGAGKTGGALARLFAEQGAKVFITDLDNAKILNLTREFSNIEPAQPKAIYNEVFDIYSPCALGNDITRDNVNKIKAQLIIGTANNQLEDLKVAERLFKLGILHIPDYIANAGGLINVADELLKGGYSNTRVKRTIKILRPVLERILETAYSQKINPDTLANTQAEAVFVRSKQKTFVSAI